MAYAMSRLPDDALDIDALARHARMSRRTFDRRWRAATGCSPLQWRLTQRVLHAQRLLETTGLTVDAVARRSGFADAVAMRPHFRRVVHVSPQAYRDTYQGRDLAVVSNGSGQ
jgi:transcriptional regulator GlxA family with amidase domain